MERQLVFEELAYLPYEDAELIQRISIAEQALDEISGILSNPENRTEENLLELQKSFDGIRREAAELAAEADRRGLDHSFETNLEAA